jgi:pSer/pThr/pTyr-binding forkhead associated (FHA) protein
MDVQLVLVKGAPKRQTLRLRSEETIVGRREGCDVRIPSAKVSRRHCRLSVQDDVLMAEDLDSANGTYVNGERIGGLVAVRPGDRLEIGPVTFEVKYSLSPKAVDYLLKQSRSGEVPVVDVEELTEVQDAPVEEAVPDALVLDEVEEQETVQLEMVAEETPSPAAKDADTTAPEIVDDEPVAAEIFEDRDRWQMPAGEDIRDILSKLDE